jgi:ABC-2 type transport system permease protein
VAFVGVLLLYGQLFGYGVAVASGVVEEKSSRVIELLLSAIRPRQLLTGKILGIGALGFLQLLGVGIVGIVTAKLSGGFTFPPGSAGIVVTVLAFFVLGFAFYSSLFAVAGSMVPRQEELQNSMTPLSLVIVISFFVSIAALNNPDSTSAVIASLLPPSAPLAMPIRVAQGAAPVWQIVASVLISIATTAALVPVAGRLYSAAILRTGGRVRIREAWRAASAERVPR